MLFFPSAIRSWNYLHPSIKNANTIEEFKMKLSKQQNINTYYSMDSRCINSILASMRMHCSQLKSDIYRNNISFDKYCICGEEETVFHYFFECRNCINPRNTLLNEILSIANISVLKILHGDERLCIGDNMKLHQAVSRFIISTKRFNIY